MDKYTFHTIHHLCRPGSTHRPCEDLVNVGDTRLLLLDGASPLAPSIMSSSDAAWFVQEADRMVSTLFPIRGEPLPQFLMDCMRCIHWDIEDDAPSAGIALLRLEEDRLDYLLLGDCAISIEKTDGTVLTIEDDTLRRLDNSALTALQAHAARLGAPPRDCLAFIQDTLRQNRALRNTSMGYYILDPSGKGIPHAVTGSLPATDVQSIFLCSDGFAQLCQFTGGSLTDLHRQVKENGLESLYHELCAHQDSDPSFQRVPRFKHRDDASAVLAKIKTATEGG